MVHTVQGTSANAHDETGVRERLTGEETVVNGNNGYLDAQKLGDTLGFNHQENESATR